MTRYRHFWPVALALALAVCGGVVAARAGAARVRDAASAIGTALEDQGVALLSADKAGWLRPVDKHEQTTMLHLYENLRGFQVSAWIPRTTSVSDNGSLWRATVQVRVCFAGARCVRGRDTYVRLGDVIVAETVWRVAGDSAALVNFAVAGSTSAAAVPWKTTALTFAWGSRVIVAASQGSLQPSTWLAAADRAAQAADRYSLVRPGKYLVYLAADGEWQAVVGEHGEALGFVDRTSEETAFTVVDAAEKPDEKLLRHELGHVATLLGTLEKEPDWAIEGMAEYIAWEQTPMSAYRLTQAARDHIVRTGWQGRLDLPWSSVPTERVGFYAMAYLAMRCLAVSYGEKKLLMFFSSVVRSRQEPASAAMATLGASWPAVQETCQHRIGDWLG